MEASLTTFFYVYCKNYSPQNFQLHFRMATFVVPIHYYKETNSNVCHEGCQSKLTIPLQLSILSTLYHHFPFTIYTQLSHLHMNSCSCI